MKYLLHHLAQQSMKFIKVFLLSFEIIQNLQKISKNSFIEWFGEWNHLEESHSFIQWLFPIRESGLNFNAQPMTKYEASLFRKTPEIQKRLIKSYEMMLDFYGFVLVNKATGTISRNPKTYQNRFLFLNRSFHNYLRITRLMKCLGICGMEKFKKPFLKHFVIEVFKYGNIRNATESLMSYWIPTLRQKQEITELDDLVKKITGKSFDRDKGFGWGDEQTTNWQTECYITYKMNEKDERDEMKKETNLRAQTENPDENVLTFPIDPFQAIHEEKESLKMQPDMWSESYKKRIPLSDSDSDDSNGKDQKKKNIMRKNRQMAPRDDVIDEESNENDEDMEKRSRISTTRQDDSRNYKRFTNFTENDSKQASTSNGRNSVNPNEKPSSATQRRSDGQRDTSAEQEQEGDDENERRQDSSGDESSTPSSSENSENSETQDLQREDDEEEEDLANKENSETQDEEGAATGINQERDSSSQAHGSQNDNKKKKLSTRKRQQQMKTEGIKTSTTKKRLNFRTIKENEHENEDMDDAIEAEENENPLIGDDAFEDDENIQFKVLPTTERTSMLSQNKHIADEIEKKEEANSQHQQ